MGMTARASVPVWGADHGKYLSRTVVPPEIRGRNTLRVELHGAEPGHSNYRACRVRLSCIREFGDLNDAYKLFNLSNHQWVEMRIGGIKTKGFVNPNITGTKNPF
jgi:hypothetical protein